MGLAESRMILVKLETACIEAECRGHREVKNLLSDNEFVKHLSNVWRDLPVVSQRQIQERRKNRKKKASQDHKLIDLEALSLQIPQWRANLRSFFSTEKTLDLELNHPIAESYSFLLQLEARGERDTWRLRLLKVVFHYLLKKVCHQYRQSAQIERAIRLITKAEIVGDDAELISARLMAWSDIGRRLDLLCRELANTEDNHTHGLTFLGLLFRLPNHVTDSYLRKLPLKGLKRDQEIKSLRDCGVVMSNQFALIDEFARDAFNFLWGPIEVSLTEEDFLQDDGLFNRQPTQITVGQIDDNPVLQNFSVTSGRQVEKNLSGYRDGDAPWANQQATASADSDHRVSQHPEIQCSTEPEKSSERPNIGRITLPERYFDPQAYISQPLNLGGSHNPFVDGQLPNSQNFQPISVNRSSEIQTDTCPDLFNPVPYIFQPRNLERNHYNINIPFSDPDAARFPSEVFDPMPYIIPPSGLEETPHIVGRQCYTQQESHLNPIAFSSQPQILDTSMNQTNSTISRLDNQCMDLQQEPQSNQVQMNEVPFTQPGCNREINSGVHTDWYHIQNREVASC